MKDNMAAARDARVLSRCRAALGGGGREVGSGIGDGGSGLGRGQLVVVVDYRSGLGLSITTNCPLVVWAAIKVHGRFQGN